ncbi:MAG: hypothetical protein ABJB98_03380 [Actinomycetota bacterium]
MAGGGYLSGEQPVDPHSDPYTGPPPMQPPPPPEVPYYPPAAPGGYPTAGYQVPYGYPPASYPAYPQPMAYGPPRPGQVIAAAVLGYVDAGLLILAGVMLFFGASILNGLNSSFGDTSSVTAELVVDGLLNLLAGGLLIAGGVGLANRNPTGRTLFTIGAAICIAEGVYWLIRVRATTATIWVLLFTSLPIIGLAMIWTRDVRNWLSKT